jgi:two-component system sensor histidine kinase DegS
VAESLDAVAERVRGETSDLERELAEIEMLISQARSEASRHEARRAAAAEKLAALPAESPLADAADLHGQVVTLTKRAAVMEAQVDVLTGKQKALARYRDAVARLADELAAAQPSEADGTASPASAEPTGGMSRIVLSAQEDLRREIARAMHDGPAQSLTNIVLQAEIVDRLVGRDDEAARKEMKILASMVQQTLEATKSFIFDVRPMVLDDLGLVPTLRRAARERSRRAQIPVEFDSVGQDRRLPMDLESGLFRIVDEAVAAYLDAAPDRVTVALDWNDGSLHLVVRAVRAAPATSGGDEVPEAAADLPPALAAMIEDRRAAKQAARAAAEEAARVVLPPSVARDLVARAAALGGSAELLDGGAELRVAMRELPTTAG